MKFIINKKELMKPIEIELSIQNYCNNCKSMRVMKSNISDNYEIKHCKKYKEDCKDCVLNCEIIILNRKLKKIKNTDVFGLQDMRCDNVKFCEIGERFKLNKKLKKIKDE